MTSPSLRGEPATVSVVVPVLNGERTLVACIESLLAQDYPRSRYEVIVVDNGSRDRSREIAASYPEIRRLDCPRPGPSAARNDGVAAAGGDIVAFTDSDCEASRGWLAGLVAAYDDDTVGGAGGEIRGRPSSDPSFTHRFCELHPPLSNYLSGEGELLPHLYTANASYRRSLLAEHGAFDEELALAEDVELSWRLQLRGGVRLAYRPEAFVWHSHPTTPWRLAKRYWVYGTGEIVLDTRFRHHPGYPRRRGFVFRRLLGQAAALPRYLGSVAVRSLRCLAGRATAFDLAVPMHWLVIESAALAGKVFAIAMSVGLTQERPLEISTRWIVPKLYPSRPGRGPVASGPTAAPEQGRET